MPKPTPYTAEEKQWLRRHYTTSQRADLLAHFPTRTWESLQALARKQHATGRQVPGRFRSTWNAERLALLRLHYPRTGSAGLPALTGCTAEAVRKEACKQGLRAPYMPRPATPAKAYVPRPPRERPQAPPGPLLAVRRSAQTPNLNIAKEARRRAEEAPKNAAGITADQIRKMPYNDPQRVAYTLGGVSGWQQWKAAQRTPTR